MTDFLPASVRVAADLCVRHWSPDRACDGARGCGRGCRGRSIGDELSDSRSGAGRHGNRSAGRRSLDDGDRCVHCCARDGRGGGRDSRDSLNCCSGACDGHSSRWFLGNEATACIGGNIDKDAAELLGTVRVYVSQVGYCPLLVDIGRSVRGPRRAVSPYE